MLKNFSGKALIAATVSSLVTISGLTLFGIENFKGDFRFFERTNFNYPAADSVGVVSALSMQHVGDINGFETGKYDTYNEQDLNSVVTQINKDAAVTVLFVIGEVDKRELNANLKKELGSNLTLARSRAEIISAKLQEKFGTRSILTLSRGALHPGNTSIGEKEDRKVSVYAMKIGG